MENKSRVLKYQELRDKISKMDVYSFAQQDELGKEEVIDLHPRFKKKKENGVKKNTLSISLDELMADKEESQAEKEKKETKRLYKEKKRNTQKHLTQGKVLLIVLIPCLLILAFFLVLIFTKVI